MLSERTRSEGTYTLAAGIWSAETVGLACKCYFYIWMWPMLKKKKKMRYLTFKKSRFLAFLEKKILSKGLAWLHLLLHLYQSASTVQELPSLEVACVVQFPAISMAPEVIQTLRSHDRCLSPLHYLSLPVFRVCPPWTGWIHSEELLPFTWVIWLVCFLRNTNNIVTTQMRGRLICLRLSSSIIIWR